MSGGRRKSIASQSSRRIGNTSTGPWAADEFEATEELFDLGTDRLEITNAATNIAHREQLKVMRETYDAAVEHWKDNAVPYHNYAPFGMIFDRNVDWSEKAPLYQKKKRR